MKIAVTTVSGQLGSTVIKRLIQDIGSQHVVGIARSPHKAEYLNVEIRKGDYDNRNDFEQSLQDIDSLLIVSNTGDPTQRPAQHRNIIQAAKTCGVKKIVYTSILGPESGTSFSPVVMSNRETEMDIQQSGLSYAIGRNSLYIEPDLESIDHYKKPARSPIVLEKVNALIPAEKSWRLPIASF